MSRSKVEWKVEVDGSLWTNCRSSRIEANWTRLSSLWTERSTISPTRSSTGVALLLPFLSFTA